MNCCKAIWTPMQGSWRYNNNAGNDNSGLASSTGGNVHAKDDLQRRASGRKPYIRRALLASRLGQVMHLRAHWPRLRRAHLHTRGDVQTHARSEEHTSELQSLMRISYAVFCLKKKTKKQQIKH